MTTTAPPAQIPTIEVLDRPGWALASDDNQRPRLADVSERTQATMAIRCRMPISTSIRAVETPTPRQTS